MKKIIYFIALFYLWTCSSSPTESKIVAPIVQNISATTIEDGSVIIIFQGSDPQGLPLSYSLKTQPQNGTFVKNSSSGRYTPNQNFNGSDSFTYSATNGNLESNIGTISITINEIDDSPEGKDKTIYLDEDTSIEFSLEANEYDGDSISFRIKTYPSNGNLSLNQDKVSFTPNDNYFGQDSFTFEAFDSNSKSIQNEATITLIINPINDKPELEDMSVTALKDEIIQIYLNGSDVDGDNLSYLVVSAPTKGNASIKDNVLSYQASELGNDEIVVKASDGSLESDNAQISIDIDWKLLSFENSNSIKSYSFAPSNNGYVFAGSIHLGNNAGDNNFYVMEVDSNLEKIFDKKYTNWSHTYFGDEFVRKIINSPDGGYYLLGYANIGGYDVSDDFSLIKVDNQGNEVWTKLYGGTDSEKLFAGRLNSDGTIMLVGWTYSFGEFDESAWANFPNVYVIKVDANGNEIWSNAYGGVFQDVGYSIEETNQGYIVTGFSNSLSDGLTLDTLVLQIDKDGDQISFNTLGNSEHSNSYSVKKSQNGNFIIASNVGSFDYSIIQLSEINLDGSISWQKDYPVDYMAIANDVIVTDNFYYIIGYTRSSIKNNDDIIIIKTDLSGNEIWSKTYGNDENEYAYEGQYIDNSLLITGFSESDKERIIFLKVDLDGNRIF